MFSFQLFCEYMVSTNRPQDPYSWFYCDPKLLSYLTTEEQSLVYVEDTNIPDFKRVFYPRSKWEEREMPPEELMQLMMKALEKQDFEIVKKLKERMKK